jgi:hypothetical protein
LEGYEFRVTGSVYESTATMTFEIKETGKKTQVTITNIKNYYVKWAGKAQMRFEPKEPDNFDNEKLRLYYDISPKDDELTWSNPNHEDFFRIVPGKSADGRTKWIDFKKPVGRQYFGACGVTTYLYTKKTNEQISLDVYIYYEKVDVTWAKGDISFIETKLGSTASNPDNRRSSFDAVTRSVIVCDNEKITVNRIIDEVKYAGHGVQLSLENSPVLMSNGINVQPTANGDGVIIWYQTDAKNLTNDRATYIDEIKYAGMLTVVYRYFNGNKGTAGMPFYHNILIYAATVSRYVKP